MARKRVASWVEDIEKLKTSFKCSNCGEEPMFKPAKNGLAFVCLTPYCPHCGCKMKHEGEELWKD